MGWEGMGGEGKAIRHANTVALQGDQFPQTPRCPDVSVLS
jgi:hypothetical protein